MGKKFDFFRDYATRANFEILKSLSKVEFLRFKDLRKIKNPYTLKTYSSKTISEKLKKLEESGFVENKLFKVNKQKMTGYCLTEKGRKSLEIVNEAIDNLEKLNFSGKVKGSK